MPASMLKSENCSWYPEKISKISQVEVVVGGPGLGTTLCIKVSTIQNMIDHTCDLSGTL